MVSAIKELRQHLPGLLNSPKKLAYAVINDLTRRAYPRRRMVEQFGVKTEDQILAELGFSGVGEMATKRNNPYYYLEPDFLKKVTENTRLLEEAFVSGPVELPDAIIPVNRQIKTYGKNINIQGQGEDSILRVYPNKWNADHTGPDTTWGQGPDFNISTGKNKCCLRQFAVQMAAKFSYGEYMTISGFAVSLPSDIDFILSRQNIDVEDLHFFGMNAFTSSRPWDHGTQYGLKLYNPNYANIAWVHMQCGGYKNQDGTYRGNAGVYIESVRGGYECHIRDCKIHEVETHILVKNPIPFPGNFPYGQEGLKITNCTLVSGRDNIRLIGDTYGAPGWHILNNHMACERFNVYVEQMRQGWIKDNLMYNTGHNGPGIAAYIYLNISASDWKVMGNSCYYQGGPDTLKDPYGIIISGGYIPVLNRIELAVSNIIRDNLFVGKAGGGKPFAWIQDNVVDCEIEGNRRVNFAKPLRNVAQNKILDNMPGETDLGGCTVKMKNEMVVDTIPVVDENNDPVIPLQWRKVVLPRLSEGAELGARTGDVTMTSAPARGEIVFVKTGINANDPNATRDSLGNVILSNPSIYILDVQWTWAERILIRKNIVAGIDQTDPLNPVEIPGEFSGDIGGIAARYAQNFYIETEVPVKFIYHPDFMPLRQKKDITLLPGERLEFRNTDIGIQEMNYVPIYHLTDTKDNLLTGVKYLLIQNIHPLPFDENKQMWILEVKERYTGQQGGNYEILEARNLFYNIVLQCQIVNDQPWTPWMQIIGPTRYTETLEDLQDNSNYFVSVSIFGKSLWHLENKVYAGANGAKRELQVMTSEDNTLMISRARVENGPWSNWQRIGARMLSNIDYLQDNEFGVMLDTSDNLQVVAKGPTGTPYKLRRDLETVLESVITGSSKLKFENDETQREYLLSVDELIKVLRRVFDQLYLRRDNVPVVGSFNATTQRAVRFDTNTNQLVRQ